MRRTKGLKTGDYMYSMDKETFEYESPQALFNDYPDTTYYYRAPIKGFTGENELSAEEEEFALNAGWCFVVDEPKLIGKKLD